MSQPDHKLPYPIPAFNRFLKATLGRWLVRKYGITYQGREVFRKVDPPCVLLANHVTVMDPMIIGNGVPRPLYYLAGDSLFRTAFMRFLLRRVGAIPFTKEMQDMSSLRTMRKIIDRGGTLLIYPEGKLTWDGDSLPIIPSTAKLLKLLKAPVITVVQEGGYLSMPRWAYRLRRGKMVVKYELLFSREEVKHLKPEALTHRLTEALSHSEGALQKKNLAEFRGSSRAEFLEQALFLCPVCGKLNTLVSRGNYLECASCLSRAEYTVYGFLDGDFPYHSLPEWFAWQKKEWQRITGEYCSQDLPLLRQEEVVSSIGKRHENLREKRKGRLLLYRERLVFISEQGNREISTQGLAGIQLLRHLELEFYRENVLYRFHLPRRSSGLPWLWSLKTLTLEKNTDS